MHFCDFYAFYAYKIFSLKKKKCLDNLNYHTTDNIEIMNGTETNVIINELFESFLKRYQEGLETKMKGSEFVFENLDLLYYKLHKISL